MRELKRIAISSLRPDPDQPRKRFDEAELVALGNSLKQHGQHVPIITVANQIIDGERRWRAAQIVGGIDALDALVLASRPTATELRLLQMSIDAHRSNLTAMERSDFLARIKQENGWSVQEVADHLSMKQPLVTKLLKLQDGCVEVRGALSSASLEIDKAYTICQEPDHEKQRELLKQANDLTREQLRQKARSGGQPVDIKAAVARFPLPKGVMVTVLGAKMNLAGAIDAMLETVKELRKFQSQQFDVTTAMRAMRDKAKATH
jgi:ParB/RepB/Spo0J family partition protein